MRRRDRLLVRPSFELPPILNLAQLQSNLPVGASSSFLCFLGNGQKRWGKTKLTKVGLLLLIPRRWKGWSSGWLLGAASPGGMLRAAALPGAANQGPGTGAEMRPIAPIWSTHLSRPPHPRKPKKSSGSQTGAHLLTFPRRFGQGPLLLLFGV